MSNDPITPQGEKIRQILTWVGVSQQLLVTRINRALKDTDLPFSQFTVLNHFYTRRDQGWTVTRLANAFEMGQPGMTKMARRLVGKGYLRIEPDPGDGRVKFHYLTAKGKAAYEKALGQVAPEAMLIFAEWNAEDLDALHAKLFKLKSWLDDNREGPA
ncbi:MAG: MarR family winged helix-turn-helix transcriptional regulator [Alphaproteobacteria bacterium]